MTSHVIREAYLKFFEKKGHAIVPSASLMPENDPTTLFTGSGMQPILPYLLGEKHPKGLRIVDSQKSIRAGDIEEVGDNRHTTMFEMLGNWSFGDYFKKEQLPWIYEFLIDVVGLDPNRLYATVFSGNESLGIPKDEESATILKEVFKKYDVDPEGRIFYYDETKNWWSRSGVPDNMPIGEPGGPDSEIFWDFGAGLKLHGNSEFKKDNCHVNCDCGRYLEIGNSVFMEYIKTEKGFEKLKQPNVDFGGGLERIAAAKNDSPDIFEIDLFKPLIEKTSSISGKKYDEKTAYAFRIIADHMRAATFIMGDDKGITPSNRDQGYVVRRLIRRAVRYGKQLEITHHPWTHEIAEIIINEYKDSYPELKNNAKFIMSELTKEEKKFNRTLEKGLRELNKLESIDPEKAFHIYQTYGFPLELIQEEVGKHGLNIDEDAFKKEAAKHQDISRTAASGKFKGGLADESQNTIKLHTATHLLNEALRKAVDPSIKQRGSNITSERLRFDFNFDRTLTEEEVTQVEEMVNEHIKKAIPIEKTEMPLNEALASGAESEFGTTYPDTVSVYSIGDFSKELCGGPHVQNTSEIGEFKITKQESVGAGLRRIKATVV